MNITTFIIIVLICVIIATIWLISYRAEAKSRANASSHHNDPVILKTTPTDVLPVMTPHHKKVYDMADDIMMWKPNNNKYDWATISESMQLDPDAVKFNFDTCLNCGEKSTILFAFHEFQCVYDTAEKEYMLLCPICKTLFHKDNISKYLQNQEDYLMRLKHELLKINSKFSFLFNVLDEMGCQIEYRSDFGLYGLFRVTYSKQDLYIEIRKDDPIMIFYPNWSEISKAQMSSSELDSIIRSINMSHGISIVWMGNGNKVQLSTFGNILLGNDMEDNLTSLKMLFDELIESPHYFEMSQKGINTTTISHDKQNIDLLLHIFEKAGCSRLNVDDEGDLNITYDGQDLLVRMTNEKSIKISYNACFYRDVNEKVDTEEADNHNDYFDTLVFQWNNIIYPIKSSYYEFSEGLKSVTLYIDCNLQSNNEENIEFIKYILPKLINAEKEQLTNLLMSGTDEAIDDVAIWCDINELRQEQYR